MAKKQAIKQYLHQTAAVANDAIFTPSNDGLYRVTAVIMIESDGDDAYPSLWGINVQQADGSQFSKLSLGVPCRVGVAENRIRENVTVLYLKDAQDLVICVDNTGPAGDGSFTYGTYSVYIYVEELNA
jgi:hypothetical protein